MIVKKFLHTRLRVNDLDTSIAFYTKLLGLTVQDRKTSPRGSSVAFLSMPNSEAQLELTQYAASGPVQVQEDLVHLAFLVDSLDELLSWLTIHGVKVTDGPHITKSGSRFLFIDDPDQYEIELIEWARAS